jgi:hypothetical protein
MVELNPDAELSTGTTRLHSTRLDRRSNSRLSASVDWRLHWLSELESAEERRAILDTFLELTRAGIESLDGVPPMTAADLESALLIFAKEICECGGQCCHDRAHIWFPDNCQIDRFVRLCKSLTKLRAHLDLMIQVKGRWLRS